MQAPRLISEAARIDALLSFGVLDTSAEPEFDRIVRVAGRLFDTPMALISLLDGHRQWFKARIGIEVCQTAREDAFCAHTILTDNVMTVPDAREDPRFRDNRLVTGAPHIRFYAGAPLKARGGFNLGTLCVLDDQPHPPLSKDEEECLADLAAMVMSQLEARRIRRAAQGPALPPEAAELLRAAKEAAERASAAKSSFLAVIGHELRTPLNAVIGFSEMMREEVLGPLGSNAYRDYAAAIGSSGRSLMTLVSTMMEYSQAEGGTLPLEESWFDAGEALSEAVAMLLPAAKQAGARIEVATAASGTSLFADRIHTVQMLSNLIGNAIKFTGEAGTIFARIEIRRGQDLRFVVVDTGAGMDESAIRNALTPFSQDDARLARAFPGCGLGLPLTCALIEQHGGTMAIESEAGHGTRVELRFPLWRIQPGTSCAA